MRFLLTFCLLLICAIARGQEPVVMVQGYSQFSSVEAYGNGETIRIDGTLKDDLGHDIPGQDIQITHGGKRYSIRTGDDGKFHISIPQTGKSLTLEYRGIDSLIGTRLNDLPIREDTPSIRVDAPNRVAVDADFSVIAYLTRGNRPYPRTTLILETERTRTMCSTDAEGQCRWSLSSPQPGTELYRIIWPGTAPPLVSEHQVQIEQELSGQLIIHGLMDGAEGTFLTVELKVKEPKPVRSIGSIRLNGRTIESREITTSTRFRLPWNQLEPGENIISGQIRTDEVGWSAYVFPDERYVRPDQWVASRWPIYLVWGALAVCVTLLGVRSYKKRQREQLRPPVPEKLTPMAVFDEDGSVHVEDGFLVFIVAGETGCPINAHVTACRDIETALAARIHESSGMDAKETMPGGQLRFRIPPPALLVQSEGRFPLACVVPPTAKSARLEMWGPRAYVQRTFMEFLSHTGFPRLVFGRETPREAGWSLKERGFHAELTDTLVERVEELLWRSPISIEDVLLFERDIKVLRSGSHS